tara:strand:- start:129 stop:371 length:243 start_codon:yes stop_codon:yes gene_type:complete
MSCDERHYVVKKRTGWDKGPDNLPRPQVVRANLTLQEARHIVACDDAERARIIEDPESTAMDRKQAFGTRCYIDSEAGWE